MDVGVGGSGLDFGVDVGGGGVVVADGEGVAFFGDVTERWRPSCAWTAEAVD